MKCHVLLLSLILFTSCSNPEVQSPLEHMRKSEAIEIILDNIEDLNYDDSYSELDRDSLRLNYAKNFHHEVWVLTDLLKKQPDTLPNHQTIKEDQKNKYHNIISLLEENLLYLDEIIKKKKGSLVLKAIKDTKQSCILCHSEFKPL